MLSGLMLSSAASSAADPEPGSEALTEAVTDPAPARHDAGGTESDLGSLLSLEGMRRRRPGVLCDGTTGDPSLTAGSGGPATYAAGQARQPLERR